MKVQLISPVNVQTQTIDHLIEGISALFPASLDLVAASRFRVGKKKILSSKKSFLAANPDHFFLYPETDENFDGVRNDAAEGREVIYYNLQKPVQRFRAQHPDGILLVLFNKPYMIPNPSHSIYSAAWAGNGGKRGMYYSGLFIPSKRLAIIGGDFQPSENNVKLACHEIAHAALEKDHTNEDSCSKGSPDHCNGSLEGKYCIMNPQGRWKDEVDQTYLGFCGDCKAKIHNAHPLRGV